jgi:HAD superfamily hydrolase (TIGR01459 family)
MDALTDIPILSSVRDLGSTHRVWLTDIWGVMHDGVAAFPDAVRATEAFRDEGGIVILLSNAPRPAGSVAAQIESLGVPDTAYDAIVSSGDLTRALLAAQPGVAVHHLGPERDAPVFEGLDIVLTSPENSRLTVCTGLLDDDTESPEDYGPMLRDMAERGLPMICANPDIKVERGDRLVWCAGALAQLYQGLGGAVVYAGKPHAPVYDMALAKASELAGEAISDANVLAIGDGLDTDMKGAAARGFDAVFIASGLHLGSAAALDGEQLARLFQGRPRPRGAMPALAW